MGCSSGYCVPQQRPELLSMCTAGTDRVAMGQGWAARCCPYSPDWTAPPRGGKPLTMLPRIACLAIIML